METMFRTIGRDRKENAETFQKASQILRGGGLVAFPTETVYGLGGNGLDKQAALKIYAAKGRPSDNPLIIHIADLKAFNELCVDIPQTAYLLAEKFWPGPLTLVMKKHKNVPYTTTGGLDTVAVRMPNHPTALRLIKKSGIYIAAPSANLSGRPSPTNAAHVLQDLNGKIDMIIGDGEGDIGIESTIVDLTGRIPMILRPGYITKEMLCEVLGQVEIDPAVEQGKQNVQRPKAPGMKYRHYAPKGEMVIVEGMDERAVVNKINSLVRDKRLQGIRTGVLATDRTKGAYRADYVISVGSRENERCISSRLFDALRRFDDFGAEFIVSESFPRKNVGYAIMNRLSKAAGGRIINLDEKKENEDDSNRM